MLCVAAASMGCGSATCSACELLCTRVLRWQRQRQQSNNEWHSLLLKPFSKNKNGPKPKTPKRTPKCLSQFHLSCSDLVRYGQGGQSQIFFWEGPP